MAVPMMRIGKVMVCMYERWVRVPMTVRQIRHLSRRMAVAVMVVVHVQVLVEQGFVNVFVFVTLGQVQPQPHPHEQTGSHELHRQGLAKQHGHGGTDEWRRGEIRPGSRGAEMAQRHDEQHRLIP